MLGPVEVRGAAQLGRTRLENVFQRGEVGLQLTPDGPLDERFGELEEAARLTFHDDVDTRPSALGLVGLVDVELHRTGCRLDGELPRRLVLVEPYRRLHASAKELAHYG